MKNQKFIFLSVLFILFSLHAFANPLCQENIAELSVASPKVFEFFKATDLSQASSDEILILGPDFNGNMGLNQKIRRRLVYVTNQPIQSFEVNLSRKLGGLLFERLGRYVSKDKGYKVFSSDGVLDVFKEIAIQLVNDNWFYLGINSKDFAAPNSIPEVLLNNPTYDFPSLRPNLSMKAAVIDALRRGGTNSAINKLRANLPENSTLDIFVQSTGFFSFKLTAIFQARHDSQ